MSQAFRSTPCRVADTIAETLANCLARLRVRADGEVIQLSRENVLALVQTDAELSEILMRAFLLRRAELIAQGIGDATLVGSSQSADTLRIKEFFTRNGNPYTYIDLERDTDVQGLLDHFHISAADTPEPRIWRRASSRTSSLPERIPAMVGFTSTFGTMPMRWVGALSG